VLKRPLATLFALIFSLIVLVLDFTAPGPNRILGFYGWAAVIVAAVLIFVVVRNWATTKSLVPAGILRPREAAFFIAGAVAAASIAGRATAAFPLAHSFTTLPHWPPLYLCLFALIIAAGSFMWFSGRELMPWGFFSLLVLAALNGLLFKLGAGGYGVFFGFTAAVFFFQTSSLPGAKPRLSYVGAALIIFIAAAFVSLLWSQDWGGSFRAVFFLATGFLVFTVLARELEAADVLALPAAVIWAVLVAEVACEAMLAVKFAMVWRWIPLNVPPEDLFWTMDVSRNALSTYFVAALPFLLINVKSARPAAPRWLLWAQIALSIAVPALTLSKSAVLGLLVVLWFAFAFGSRERRMNLKLLASGAVLAFVVILLLLVLVLPGGVARFLTPKAYTGPLLMFKVAFGALRDHVLTGVGLGSDLSWAAQAGTMTPDELATVPAFLTEHSPSVLLEVTGTMGLLGLVGLFIVIQSAAWAGTNLVKIERDRFFFGMVSASLAGAAAILAVALGLATSSPIPVIVFVGLAMFEGGVRRRGLAARAPKWLTVTFVVMVAAASALGLLAVASRQDVGRGELCLGVGDFDGAERAFGRAALLAPWDPAPHAGLGRCRLENPRGELSAVFASYRAAAARSRGNAAYWEKLGLLSWAQGDSEKAGDYLARAVVVDPAGLVGGGNHQVNYALLVASRGDGAAARVLLAEAVAVDPLLSRSAAFVTAGPAASRYLYLRPVPAGGARDLVLSLLGARGYEPRSLPLYAADVPASYRRDLCLEDIYVAEFRRTFALAPTESGIARPGSYLLGEGYAETRTRSHAIFRDVAASRVLAADDAGVGLAVNPPPPGGENDREEIKSLLGMALLAHRLGESSALSVIAAEFELRAAELRSHVGGADETHAAKVDRLAYEYLDDERADTDLELADALLAAGDASRAERYYRRALELLVDEDTGAADEDIPRAVRGALRCDALAALAEGGGRPSPGLPYVRKPAPAAYAAEAYAEEYYGDYKRALVRFRDGLARYPRDAGLRLALAAYYERRGRADNAIASLTAEDAPRDLVLWRTRAETEARGGDEGAALRMFREIEAEYPGDLVTYLAQAAIYAERGDFERAFAVFERGRERTPPGSLWASRYAAALLAGGDAEGAAYYFEQARAANPFDLEPYIVWGEELCRRERAEEGLSLLRKAVALDDDSTWARLALANCYRRLGRRAEAEATYRAGIAREGLGSPMSLAYDDYLKEVGDTAGRRRVLEAALKSDPANAALRTRLGEIALAGGEREKGLKLLKEALALEPASAGANAALGFYYRRHGDAAAAVEYLERARAASPDFEPYRILLADAYIEVGRYADALGELDAVAEPTRLPKALALRAKAYYNLGDEKAASAAAARALELDPELREAEEFIIE
jgi:tetratricopeptide (TPR) repeat protein